MRSFLDLAPSNIQRFNIPELLKKYKRDDKRWFKVLILKSWQDCVRRKAVGLALWIKFLRVSRKAGLVTCLETVSVILTAIDRPKSILWTYREKIQQYRVPYVFR
jgi:hypothetical protein